MSLRDFKLGGSDYIPGAFTSHIINFIRIIVFVCIGTYLGALWASMYVSAHILYWVGIK